MSIMRGVPTGITGIANVWSNFDHFSKNMENTAFLGEKCTPPKLKLRIYLAGFIPLRCVCEPTSRPRHLRCGRIYVMLCYVLLCMLCMACRYVWYVWYVYGMYGVSVCLSVCPSVRLSVGLSVRRSVRRSMRPSVCMYCRFPTLSVSPFHQHLPTTAALFLHMVVLDLLRANARKAVHGQPSKSPDLSPFSRAQRMALMVSVQAQVSAHPALYGSTAEVTLLKDFCSFAISKSTLVFWHARGTNKLKAVEFSSYRRQVSHCLFATYIIFVIIPLTMGTHLVSWSGSALHPGLTQSTFGSLLENFIHAPEKTFAIAEKSSQNAGVHIFSQGIGHLGSTVHPCNYNPFFQAILDR